MFEAGQVTVALTCFGGLVEDGFDWTAKFAQDYSGLRRWLGESEEPEVTGLELPVQTKSDLDQATEHKLLFSDSSIGRLNLEDSDQLFGLNFELSTEA